MLQITLLTGHGRFGYFPGFVALLNLKSQMKGRETKRYVAGERMKWQEQSEKVL